MGAGQDNHVTRTFGMETTSARDLLNTDLPETRWTLEGLLPEGLALLAGKPKARKGWMALQIASAVVQGSSFLGRFQAEKGEVLAVLLEDSKARIKGRLEEQLSGEYIGMENFHTLYERPDLDTMRAWFQNHPRTRLVIIDTLERFRTTQSEKGSQYSLDYGFMANLKAIADEFHITVLALHHLRKGEITDPLESVNGTYGLVGACDTVLVLQKLSAEENASLFATGRDIEEIDFGLRFSPSCLFELCGDMRDLKMSDERKRVIEALRTAGESALSPKEVAGRSGLSHAVVKHILPSLARTTSRVQRLGVGKYKYVDAVVEVSSDASVH